MKDFFDMIFENTTDTFPKSILLTEAEKNNHTKSVEEYVSEKIKKNMINLGKALNEMTHI